MQYFGVKNYERFQHHKKKGPPWVKLHASILTDIDFLRLTDAQRYQLMALFIVASECDNCIPNDRPYLVHRLSTHRLQVDALISAGFLYSKTKDIPDQLGAAQRRDGTTETETETEREERERVATLPAAKKGTRWDGRPVPKPWVDWAVGDLGMTPGAANEAALSFSDYWVGAPKGVKLNWEGTWRNWCRKDVKDAKRGNGRDDAATRALLSA
jgi:hypothetical protein